MKTRNLKQTELIGTHVRRKDRIGKTMKIVGSVKESPLHPKSGFIVKDDFSEVPLTFILPFNNIHEWEVIEK